MSLVDKVAAKFEQAKHEIRHVNLPPNRAQREADNREHDEAERRNASSA